jgi:hypothetical protein
MRSGRDRRWPGQRCCAAAWRYGMDRGIGRGPWMRSARRRDACRSRSWALMRPPSRRVAGARRGRSGNCYITCRVQDAHRVHCEISLGAHEDSHDSPAPTQARHGTGRRHGGSFRLLRIPGPCMLRAPANKRSAGQSRTADAAHQIPGALRPEQGTQEFERPSWVCLRRSVTSAWRWRPRLRAPDGSWPLPFRSQNRTPGQLRWPMSRGVTGGARICLPRLPQIHGRARIRGPRRGAADVGRDRALG